MYESQLIKKSAEIRKATVKLCFDSGDGLFASSSSCVELLVALHYGRCFDFKTKDYFILSKGHASASYYNVLADQGYFPKKELKNYCKGGMLQLHPHIGIPGVQFNTGSLGHGLPFGVGLALGLKMRGEPGRVVVLMGDAECQEGTTWEAALFANQHNLDNLLVIVDRNHMGATGFINDSMSLETLTEKFSAFHWNVKTCWGHDIISIMAKLDYFNDGNQHWANKPMIIIARTVKGRGIQRIEITPDSHLMRVGRDDL